MYQYVISVLLRRYEVCAMNEFEARKLACRRFMEDEGFSVYEYDGSVVLASCEATL